MYDLIGDIHGHADELIRLLERLDYRLNAGVYSHPSRKVIFCGDFVDRGPEIPRVVQIARQMVDAGNALAVMGNHEFNALAFHTEDPNRPGRFFRRHSEKNILQHRETLNQFSPAQLQDALRWFATLPPFLDLQQLRIVHACWCPQSLDRLRHAIDAAGGAMSADFLKDATTPGEPLFDAVETVMKGPELPLPNGMTASDSEGTARRRLRIRWFEPPAGRTWKDYALPAAPALPNEPVPSDAPAVPYPSDAPPVFIGHYWLQDKVPAPLADNVACLDYSVARGGALTAYRFDGERRLIPEHFVQVPSSGRK